MMSTVNEIEGDQLVKQLQCRSFMIIVKKTEEGILEMETENYRLVNGTEELREKVADDRPIELGNYTKRLPILVPEKFLFVFF